MEQDNGAQGVLATHSARNVLPGEPFDPPPNSQVPGPRPAPVSPAAAPPAAPVAYPAQQAAEALPPPLWNYGPAAEPFAPQAGVPVATAPAGDFETLQNYATLPAAQPFGAPAAPQSYAPQSYAPQSYAPQEAPAGYAAPPAYGPQDGARAGFAAAAYAPSTASPAWPAQATPSPDGFGLPHTDMSSVLPPLPSAPIGEEPPSRGKRRGMTRSGKAPDKRLLAVALVAVLAGGGYFGYSQLSKKSDSTPTATTPTTPTVPVAPAVTPYAFPSHVAGFLLHTGSAAQLQNRQLKAFAIKAYPTFGKTVSIASYSVGSASTVAMSFRPGTARLAATYSTVLANVRKPAAGNVVGAFTAVAPGAAGGKMTCGGQRGASPISYCVWQGKTTVGLMYVTGSPKSQITEILTREIRAYAEH